MPKKTTRHAHVRQTASSATAVATAATTTASADSAGSGLLEKPNKRHRSVHIGPKNGRRWLSLKKRLGLPTDDDLVVYLLDLAESITERRDEIQCVVEKKVITPAETSSDIHDRPRRSQRKLVAAEESLKNDKSEKLEKVVNSPVNQDKIIQQDPKSYSKSCSRPSKVKRHKNKARHHKEKRKKKKHQKIKDLKNLLTLENKISNNIFWQFDSESDTEKCPTDLQDNFISQTINDQSSKDFDLEDSDNKEETFEKLPHDTSAQTISSEDNRTNEFIDHNLVRQTCVQEQIDIRTVQSLEAQESQVQSKSHKPLADSLEPDQSSVEHSTSHSQNELDLKNTQITTCYSNSMKKHKRSKQEANETYDLSEGLDTSYSDDSKSIAYKPDKKRHKSGDQHNKKHHDVRKAPQDGIIAGDESQDFLNCTNNLIPTTSANPVPDNSTLQTEAIIGSSEVEPPRLAIKIKLCQECNSRHLQDACPLTEPQYKIKDSISLEQWVQKHDRNSEAMKAFNSNDPMSQGYGSHADDGFDSEEEASEQYKSKIKRECEEKQQTVDVNRPLYARDSLPECLDFKLSNTDHGLGVFVKSLIPTYAQLGPLIGKSVQEMDIPDDFSMRHIWEVDINNKTMYISTTNPLTSNWIRYVRPAETKEDRNVALISKNGELFLVTTKSLIAGTELTYWSDSQSTAWTRKNKVDKTNCGGCNLNFSHPIYYRLHCCIFHDTNYSLTIRKYHCKVCGAAVLGKDNIMKHAAQLHAGRGAYQCQYCKKFFLRLNYLEMHRTYGCSQNPQRSRPLCDFCGRKFCQPQKLKVHIKRMHSDMSEVLREFQCKLCLKLLGSRAALQRHMKEVHHKDVVGAATCDRCGKMFQNKSNLKIHMLTHSGVKPFKCRENGCKAAFTTKQCLQFHYKKVHGLSEEKMPKIERSVAYTFDAYSGGLVEDAGRGKTPKFNASSAQENSDSLASFDECSSENNNATFAADIPCSSNSSSSKQLKECEESNHQISVVVPSNADSPVESAESDVDLYGSSSRVSNKDNKKWISEFDPAPNTPPATSATDIYSFHENKRDEEKIYSSNQSLIDDSSKLGLSMYRRTESANASLLVEAALDAAEREIGAVSSPILEDSDREANLYSITNELDFKTTCSQNQVVQRSPEGGHLDSYMQNELTAASPETNLHSRHTPPGHMHLDYHIHRPVEYVNTTGRAHNIEQYLDQQEVQRVIHVSQEVPTSPSRYQEMPHPHPHSHSHAHSLSHTQTHPHTHPHHHQITTDALSDDEGDSVAQNLSLPIKDKSLQQLDLTKYDGLESDFSVVNRERVRFEPLIVQSTSDQGLDMSARGFQHTFGSQAQNGSHNHHHHHHHHHQLYEMSERERQGVDLSRTSACMPSPPYPPHPYPHPYSHVDVPRVVSLESTSRSHHLHTSVSRIITSPQPANSLTPHIVSESLETRILSPPPSMPAYNTTYSVGPPYHTSRPGYHYSGYY